MKEIHGNPIKSPSIMFPVFVSPFHSLSVACLHLRFQDPEPKVLGLDGFATLAISLQLFIEPEPSKPSEPVGELGTGSTPRACANWVAISKPETLGYPSLGKSDSKFQRLA